MKASDLMTTQVVSVGPEAGIDEILAILLERRISGVPVVDAGRVVGSVGEYELLHRHEIGTQEPSAPANWWRRLTRVGSPSAAYVKSHGRHARDVMDTRVVSVTEDAPISEVASIFNARHVRRVPVLRGEQLVGILTRADLVRALAVRKQPVPASAEGNDEAIRVRLLRELEGQPWWQPQASAVFVSKGVVKYVGLCESDDERRAARVMAENIPGVRGVSDMRQRAADGESMI
ncbi:MAG: CBS domain-containing protein [Caldimonas sp.]